MARRKTDAANRRKTAAAADGALRVGEFAARVLAVVRRIPPGRVATYGDVAALAGRPRAARAVGNLMRQCHRPDVPCHRVIAGGGRLGGYGGQEILKRALLIAEGVPFGGFRIRRVDTVRLGVG
jgi:O-6-methylguanine DNA methyltransferase